MIYKISLISAILFTIFILILVRNKKLQEKYSILWFVFSFIIIIISLFYDLLDKVSVFIGIYYSPALLFLVGFIFLIFYIVHLSMVTTKQSKQIIKLNQELAIINNKLESKDEE